MPPIGGRIIKTGPRDVHLRGPSSIQNLPVGPAAAPKVLSSQEATTVLKTPSPSEDTPLWKSFGLIVVFITGLAMIFYYLRKCKISVFSF